VDEDAAHGAGTENNLRDLDAGAAECALLHDASRWINWRQTTLFLPEIVVSPMIILIPDP